MKGVDMHAAYRQLAQMVCFNLMQFILLTTYM